ncbi:MAG: hypothetical protein ACXVCY_06610 [Pseudobdellovibrionaceae bacterium]
MALLGLFKKTISGAVLICASTGFAQSAVPALAVAGPVASDSAGTSPQLFSIENLKKISITKSFDNRAELERVTQARLTARATYLSLLPRLTVGTLENGMGGSTMVMSVLQVAGDLLPFLFPANWIKAKESTLQAQAEAKTLNIQKLDVEQQVEALADLILRDIAIWTQYKALLTEIISVREKVEVLEKFGIYPVGSVYNIDSIRIPLMSDVKTLEMAIQAQKRNLSVMAGFSNPDTVLDVKWENEPFNIQAPMVLSKENAIEWGKARSVEIAQMNILIALARKQKVQAIWSWTDPSGNNFTGIGFHYPAMIQVSDAHIREMEIQGEQLKAQITNTAEGIVQDLELSKQNYSLALQKLDVETKRKNLLTNQIKLGAQIDFALLIQIYQEYLSAQTDKETRLAEYRVARARAQRLILTGSYGELN